MKSAELKSTIKLFPTFQLAHVGVHGSETANTAAREGANFVPSRSPTAEQPPIPLSTSKALLKAALQQRRQLWWFKIASRKSGTEHLSRIRTDVARAPAFFVGQKHDQALLSRLRLGQHGLNASSSRWFPGANENCNCGARETVQHFYLECPLYARNGQKMVRSIRLAWATWEVLLGGGADRVSDKAWQVVSTSVAAFVRSTGRGV